MVCIVGTHFSSFALECESSEYLLFMFYLFVSLTIIMTVAFACLLEKEVYLENMGVIFCLLSDVIFF